jgi:hypothetical protein
MPGKRRRWSTAAGVLSIVWIADGRAPLFGARSTCPGTTDSCPRLDPAIMIII